ncbi:hypothetical protein FB451DRAFT_1567373 [Mycena latifolia]|nr:hypothetical protein FB451DRAFT_1567373 [Mycena latifolia]
MKEPPLDLEYARALAHELFELERQAEEHCAVLRLDPNKTAAAYEQCTAVAPSANTSVERLQFISAALLLGQIKSRKVAEKDQSTFLKMIKIKADLHKNHVYPVVHAVMPAVSHPLLARELGLSITTNPISQPTSDNFPSILPATPFALKDILADARIPTTLEDISDYHRNPDRLFDNIFDSDEEGELKVSSILSSGRALEAKLFYVVFADEGPEANSQSGLWIRFPYRNPMANFLENIAGPAESLLAYVADRTNSLARYSVPSATVGLRDWHVQLGVDR